MSDKLRAAAEAALYILDDLNRDYERESWRGAFDAEVAALRAALAEPQQEPVAWGMPSSDGSIVDCIHPDEHAREEGGYTVPLYTHPPRREWVSLTDEERKQFANWMHPDVLAWVEAALREKNA